MKALLTVLVVGTLVSLGTALSPAEGVRAVAPLAAMSTVVLLLAYWVVGGERKPAGDAAHRKAA